jgi:O-antigen/teichoic acid export membrane protein
LYPKLIEDQKNNRNVTPKMLNYAGIFVLFGVVVAIPTWFIAPLLFTFIKPQLSQAVVPMHLLLLSLPIFFLTNILQWILLTKKKQKILAGIYALLMISNIVLNFLFIPAYGYIASAIITGVSEAIVALILFWLLFV